MRPALGNRIDLGPYILQQPGNADDDDWVFVGKLDQAMWAMRINSCAGRNPYVLVLRKMQPGDLVRTCDLEPDCTASGEVIAEDHKFEDRPATAEDVLGPPTKRLRKKTDPANVKLRRELSHSASREPILIAKSRRARRVSRETGWTTPL